MKYSWKKQLSALLVMTLAWLWNCDLRAMGNFYCPGISTSQESQSHCHTKDSELQSDTNSSTAASSSEETDCFHCMEVEWETGTSYYPKIQPDWVVEYVGYRLLTNFSYIFNINSYTNGYLNSSFSRGRPDIYPSSRTQLYLHTNSRLRI